MPRPSTVLALVAAAALAAPARAQGARPDTVLTAALVRALLAPLRADLARAQPTMGEQRPGSPGWGVWDVRAPAAGAAAEVALRAAVLAATGGRARAGGDSAWVVLAVEGPAAQAADAAVLHVDRGARWCGAGLSAAGQTYRYEFRRAGAGWAYARAVPFIAYDPPPPPIPGQARAPCGA